MNDFIDPDKLLADQETDAAKWATSFIQTVRKYNPTVDEGLMLGWFANAIMCQRDKLTNEHDLKIKILKEALEKYARPLNWVMSESEEGDFTETSSDDQEYVFHSDDNVKTITGGKWAREALKKCEGLA